jgi:hypothetical protein
MNIGDKVRLLHGNEEGTIVKISSSGRVEIEIEEGFRIPVLKNEIVVISATETSYFGSNSTDNNPSILFPERNEKSKEEGVILAYISLNDKDLALYLVNNSSQNYLVMVSEHYGENSISLIHGELPGRSSKKIGEKSVSNFEEWPSLKCLLIPTNTKIEKTKAPVERIFKYKATAFFKSKGIAPIINKNGYLFSITDTAKELDIKKLNAELNEANSHKNVDIKFEKPASEIDLHIEMLVSDPSKMSNSEMIRIQLEIFEKNLNLAIASGMDEISFIHGIGNGVLKTEIHKRLSQLKNIKYFQDTKKSQFGYGATLVRNH